VIELERLYCGWCGDKTFGLKPYLFLKYKMLDGDIQNMAYFIFVC
jgi:hypothetical protein